MNTVLIITGLLAADISQDWPQWRGHQRDGLLPGVGAPASWPKNLSLQWKTPVGGGYSSPVVFGAAVFVHSREGEEEVVRRIDLSSGKQIWRKSYTAPFKKNPYATKMGQGPFSTPLATPDRLYTFGVTANFTAWNAKTGDVIWRKDFSKELDTSKLFTGSAVSPLLEDGAIIVHVGDDRGGRVVAFDTATGAERWSWKGDGPGYASPIVATLAGSRQLITLTDRSIVSLNPADGRLLWTLPFKDEWNENIVTPIVYKDTIIFSGVRKSTFAVRPSSKAPPETVWTNSDVSFYMSSPVVAGDHLYGLSSKKRGQFVCLDARTGKTVWTTEGRDANQASVQALGDQLVFLTDGGDLVVARRSPAKFEMITRYQVAESATWAHPVILNGRIVVKDETHLSSFGIDASERVR